MIRRFSQLSRHWIPRQNWRRHTSPTIQVTFLSSTGDESDKSFKKQDESSSSSSSSIDGGGIERWLQLFPAFAVLNSAGSIFASSAIMTPELMRLHGVVTASSMDWTFSEVGPLTGMLGIGAAATGILFAEPIDRLGPRRTLFAVGTLGIASSAIACEKHTNGALSDYFTCDSYITTPSA